MKTKIETKQDLVNAVVGTMFANDMTKSISVNGKPMPVGYWNLILSIRDCGLFSKGIKPHRNWKITDVKKYFGINGNAETMYKTLELYKNILITKS